MKSSGGRSLTVPRALILVFVFAAGARFGVATAAAQGSTIECPPAATPGAPAVAETGGAATPVASETVAFPAEGGDLTVFAAASLTDAFEQVKDDLEAEIEGLRISYNFGGSQALVTQLAEGAEADVFASANDALMEAARADGTIAGEPMTFARNRLAIVVPADNPAGVDEANDLGEDGLRLVLAQPEVPVGRYARQSVCLMGREGATSGEGFVERVGGNIVSEEEDVRDVLAKVQLGEADAGIVYVSDAAAAEGEVGVIEIPDEVNVVASYPIAAVEGGNEELAEAFIAYVVGPEGQATLRGLGFEAVN